VEAERRARDPIKPPPAVLNRIQLPHSEAVQKCWEDWRQASQTSGADLADALERTTPALSAAIEELRKEARGELQKREDVWRPMALSLAAWLPEAKKMLSEADVISHLKSAEDWIRTTATTIRNERFLPIKQQVKGIWDLLRTRSHVELEDITFEGKSTSRHVSLNVTVDGTQGAALGVMSQGELHSLALALFLPRATVETSPFRFLVIDDPVQSMDPARVDGLARVLDQFAKGRQVIVFTHDDRLPEAARRLGIQTKIIEVLRGEGSLVELREVRSPVQQYFEDAFALASTKDLPKIVVERVIPGLCRQSLEAACVEVVRRRRLERGEPHRRRLLGRQEPLRPVERRRRQGVQRRLPQRPRRRRHSEVRPQRRHDRERDSRTLMIPVADYTPEDLLDAARTLLARPDARTSGVWPRAAAHLLRQALEESLDEFWKARLPVLASTSMRVQLTSLPTFLANSDAAANAAYTWACLSNACHHHPYELAPSDTELRAWIEEIERVREEIVRALSRREPPVP